MNRRFWTACIVLQVLSVPWYLPAALAERLWWGVPFWCWVTVGCYAATAGLCIGCMDRLWREAAWQGEDPSRPRER